MKKIKTNGGITLIALIITIIVMLILVTVSIATTINGELFNKAEEATRKTKEAIIAENQLSSQIINIAGNMYTIDDYVNNRPQPITSNGITYSINGNQATITAYTGTDSEIVIPSTISNSGNTYTVVGITENAFRDKDLITSVTVPSGVTSIGNWAFAYCNNLTSVELPASLLSIGTECFTHSDNLSTVIFDGTTSEWADIIRGVPDAFSYDNLLTGVTCSDGTGALYLYD